MMVSGGPYDAQGHGIPTLTWPHRSFPRQNWRELFLPHPLHGDFLHGQVEALL